MVCWFILSEKTTSDNPTGFLFLSLAPTPTRHRAAQIEQIMWFMCVSGEGAVVLANLLYKELEQEENFQLAIAVASRWFKSSRNKSVERDPDVQESNRFFVIIIHKQSADSSGMKRNRRSERNLALVECLNLSVEWAAVAYQFLVISRLEIFLSLLYHARPRMKKKLTKNRNFIIIGRIEERANGAVERAWKMTICCGASSGSARKRSADEWCAQRKRSKN